MNLDLIRELALPGDIILKGSDVFPSPIFCYAQKGLTKDGKPSLWCHGMIYIDKDTIAESTMDFKRYDYEGRNLKQPPRPGIGKKLDNGAQYNSIENYRHTDRGLLLHFPLTERQREDILVSVDAIIRMGIRYSILGLIGSLLSYYVLGTKGNPFAREHTLYCTAFVQAPYLTPNVNIDFDPQRSMFNTAPESIAQFQMSGLVKIKI